jgi:ribosomal protein S18 acetylase RimI-like enzyme
MKRASVDKKNLVVDILTNSFVDNKSVNYVVMQDRKREDRIKGLMAYSFNVCNAFGEVWLSDDEQACALILFPDMKRTTVNSIFWDVKLAVSVIGINRIKLVLERETKIKSFHSEKLLTYLWFIGVTPTVQNMGKGSELLKEIIELSNQNRSSIYLETSVEENLSWYKKFGFEIYQQLEFNYTLYLLKRACDL